MLAFFISIIFNQHFILGLLYVIGTGVKVNTCVCKIYLVWFIYIFGVYAGMKVEHVCRVYVWCIYIFGVYVVMKVKQLYMLV